MDRVVLMVIIGLLFGTTLYQAREIGKQSTVIEVQKATLKHKEAVEEIKQAFQIKRDEEKAETENLVQGLKNELIQMASDFEEKGLADPVALDARESDWLNKWVQRNSRDGNKGPHIPPANTTKALEGDN